MKIDINLDKSYKIYTTTKAKNTIFYYNGFLKIEDIKNYFPSSYDQNVKMKF